MNVNIDFIIRNPSELLNLRPGQKTIDLWIELLKADQPFFEFLTSDDKKSDQLLKAVLQEAPWCLNQLDESFLKNESVALEACEQMGSALGYFSPQIKDTFAVVWAAVSQDGTALYFASQRLKKDRSIVMRAIQTTPGALKYASSEMQSQLDVVRAAVELDGMSLYWAHPSFRKKESMIKLAIQTNPMAFALADRELRDQVELVKECMDISPYMLRFSSPRVRSQKDVAIKAIEADPSLFSVLDESMQLSESVCLTIINHWPDQIHLIPKSMEDNFLVASALDDVRRRELDARRSTWKPMTEEELRAKKEQEAERK